MTSQNPRPVETPTWLADIEAIRQVKARHFRGIDAADSALVRSVLAEVDELPLIAACLVRPAP